MNIREVIEKRRTIRLFEKKKISHEDLEDIVQAARMAPSARNIQPLEYLVIDEDELCDEVFARVHLGGDLEREEVSENRPVAYVLVLLNKKKKEEKFEHDSGLAIANMVLLAESKGVGSCIMGRIDREGLMESLNIPPHYYVDLVVAMGYPKESPRLVEEGGSGYARDEEGVLHVRKRNLSEMFHWNGFRG